VTPDAVIYRYLQIVAPGECDAQQLCLLLSVDADLLARWLKLLDVSADFAALRARLEHLEDDEFTGLAQAQAWSVLPVVGSARLSIDQWLTVLRSACLAQILARHLTPASLSNDDLPENVRMRALLAISGVQLDQDHKLTQLIEFRGTNPALLEDAALELRIFAVIDAMEMGREVDLAQQLLSISPQMFAELVSEAEATTAELVADLGIDTQADVDWARRIWLRQQISIVAASFRTCNAWHEFSALHQLVSRSLFARAPLILAQQVEGGSLSMPGSNDYSIRVESHTSVVAEAARSNELVVMNESAELAVVDRQLLRAMGAEEAYAVPVAGLSRAVVLVVGADEDIEVDIAATLYAQEIAQYLQRFTGSDVADIDANDNESTALLERFRASEYKRLREIVHEANNPLSIVHNYLHILELRLQHEPEAVEHLELIASELRRAGDLFTHARDVPNQIQVETAPGEIVELELNTWAVGLAELHTGYAAEHGVPLNLNLPTEPIVLFTQPDKLTQIVSNLTKNAIEACAPGDEVLISVRGGIYRDGNVGAEISVEDTGPGLSDDVLASLRETKPSAKGSDHQGVGMQIAYRLAVALDGALDVRTELGQGTTFSLFLPLTVAVSTA
jgi:signal transduction histidine kinase